MRRSRAWRDGRQAELVDYLAKWVEQNPAGRSAYEQYLSALIRSDEIAKAETLARTWLKAAQIAGELPAAVDGRLHLRTKADLGYALKQPRRRRWSRAAKLYLTQEMTADESFRLIILNSFSHLTANDDFARLNLHIEGVHQLLDGLGTKCVSDLGPVDAQLDNAFGEVISDIGVVAAALPLSP